jgi:hypothetical protein
LYFAFFGFPSAFVPHRTFFKYNGVLFPQEELSHIRKTAQTNPPAFVGQYFSLRDGFGEAVKI